MKEELRIGKRKDRREKIREVMEKERRSTKGTHRGKVNGSHGGGGRGKYEKEGNRHKNKGER